MEISLLDAKREADFLSVSLRLDNNSEQSLYVFLPVFPEEFITFLNSTSGNAFMHRCSSRISMSKEVTGFFMAPESSNEYRCSYYFHDIENCKNDILFFFQGQKGMYQLHFDFRLTKDYWCNYSSLNYDDINSFCKNNNYNLYEGSLISNSIEIEV